MQLTLGRNYASDRIIGGGQPHLLDFDYTITCLTTSDFHSTVVSFIYLVDILANVVDNLDGIGVVSSSLMCYLSFNYKCLRIYKMPKFPIGTLLHPHHKTSSIKQRKIEELIVHNVSLHCFRLN